MTKLLNLIHWPSLGFDKTQELSQSTQTALVFIKLLCRVRGWKTFAQLLPHEVIKILIFYLTSLNI